MKGVLELQFSLIAITLGWTLYLKISLITRSLIEADIVFYSLYCEIFRFWIIVENKLFKSFLFKSIFFTSFFKVLVPNKCYLFTGYNFTRQQWFNHFPTFYYRIHILPSDFDIAYNLTKTIKNLLFIWKITEKMTVIISVSTHIPLI